MYGPADALKASPPSAPHSTSASACWIPAISTAWATTNCSSPKRCAPHRERVTLSVKFGALARSGQRLGRRRRPARRGQELSGLLARAAGHRLHRHLPARAARPGGSDRGDHRRNRRADRGRLRAPRRAVGGRSPTRSPRMPCIRSAICRSSIRFSRAGSKTRSCPSAANGVSRSRRTACFHAACWAASSWQERGLGPGRLSRPACRALGGNGAGTWHWPRRCASSPRQRARPSLRSRLGLGALARRRRRPARRHAPTGAALAETIAALDLRLSPAELAAIEQAAPPDAVAGSRYDERQMDMLDSER